MRKLWAIVEPGRFLACRLDKGHAEFLRGIDVKSGKCLLAVLERPLIFMLGILFSGPFFVLPFFVLAWALAGLVDPHVWKKIYGTAAHSVSYKGSFLSNLDALYYFTSGWVLGVLV